MYLPEESEGASWDIMSCHVEFHVVRTVDIRSPGGSDWPHNRFVIVERMVLGFGDCSSGGVV